jgi:hypothetical protein
VFSLLSKIICPLRTLWRINALAHSFPPVMQLKTARTLSFKWNDVIIILITTCFWPNLAIFRQLFTFWNFRTHYIVHAVACIFHTKMYLSENKTLSPLRVIFLLRRPCLCTLRVCVLTSWAYVSCIVNGYVILLLRHALMKMQGSLHILSGTKMM